MSMYGNTFDRLASDWAVVENVHDRHHPDRAECGGVGACTMMAAAVDLEHDMVEALRNWRKGDPA